MLLKQNIGAILSQNRTKIPKISTIILYFEKRRIPDGVSFIYHLISVWRPQLSIIHGALSYGEPRSGGFPCVSEMLRCTSDMFKSIHIVGYGSLVATVGIL